MGCADRNGNVTAFYLTRSMVDQVLDIQSFTNGVILGIFFLGTFTKRVQSAPAIIGIVAGAAVMLFVKFQTSISWQWYVLIGSVTTFMVGWLASFVIGGRSIKVEAESAYDRALRRRRLEFKNNMKSVFIKLKVFALIFAFALPFMPVASTQTGSNLRFDRKLSKKEEDWVGKTLRSMTLDEKIGQMIIAEANVVFLESRGR